MNWYLDVLKNHYADFNGRAHREEFWMYVLFNLLVAIGVAIVVAIIRVPLLQHLYSLATLVPTLAVGARRLHDTNKSGWLQLLLLIPLLGLIILIVLWAQPTAPGSNPFGDAPRGAPQPLAKTA